MYPLTLIVGTAGTNYQAQNDLLNKLVASLSNGESITYKQVVIKSPTELRAAYISGIAHTIGTFDATLSEERMTEVLEGWANLNTPIYDAKTLTEVDLGITPWPKFRAFSKLVTDSGSGVGDDGSGIADIPASVQQYLDLAAKCLYAETQEGRRQVNEEGDSLKALYSQLPSDFADMATDLQAAWESYAGIKRTTGVIGPGMEQGD